MTTDKCATGVSNHVTTAWISSLTFLNFSNFQQIGNRFESARTRAVSGCSSFLWMAGVSAAFEQKSCGLHMSLRGGEVQCGILKVGDMIDLSSIIEKQAHSFRLST